MNGDTGEPGSEARSAVKALDVKKGPERRVLNRVFTVSGYAMCNTEELSCGCN